MIFNGKCANSFNDKLRWKVKVSVKLERENVFLKFIAKVMNVLSLKRCELRNCRTKSSFKPLCSLSSTHLSQRQYRTCINWRY